MRLAAAAIVVAALAGCGGSAPTAPAPPPPAQPAALPPLRISGDPVIDMTRGQSRALQVEERDEAGALVSRPPTAYAWISSAPGVASVGSDGVVRAFEGDLMSSLSPANVITRASAGALMDLGYPAAWYGAER